MSKTHFGHRQYTEAVIFADSAVIWCLVSILSETTCTRLNSGSFQKSENWRWGGNHWDGGPAGCTSWPQGRGGFSLKHVSSHAAKRLTANKARALITDDVTQFAPRNKKEEVCRDKIRQTRTRAGSQCSRISRVTFTWVTKETNEGSGKGFVHRCHL